MNLLSVTGVSHDYPHHGRVLHAIHLAIAPGETVALLGRSGVEVLATASTTQAANIKIGQVAELRLSESASPVRASVQRIGLRAENGSLLPVVLVPQDAT
ncbi:hypothetical protein JTM58_35335, partial [Pseudomonas aeruginosa]|nr:hypothetical protein [Pseudomonas aeruginosa]